MPQTINWKLRRTPDGWEGLVVIPSGPWMTPAGRVLRPARPLAIKAKGNGKAAALSMAASVASQIASNPLVAAALPPGSANAIKALSYLSKSAAAGQLKSAAKKVVGKGAKRLFKSLKSIF